MEFIVLFAAVVGVSVFVLWRRQRILGADLEARRHGLPDDLRDKNTGLGSVPGDGRPWGRGN
jgi:hypothetical protein